MAMTVYGDYPENFHDQLCTQYISGDGLPCICDLLDEHETIIRADQQHVSEAAWERMKASVEAEVRERLRAQVEAIQPYTHTNDHTDVVRRSDVLALLDGNNG